MSLKGIESRMLGIANKHGEHRNTEPGTDPGISGGQCRDALPHPGPRGVVQVDKRDLAAAGLWSPQTRREGTGAPLREQDHRVKPGPSGASDQVLPAKRASEAAKVSAASLFESLHAHRHRAAGATGRLSRKPQRAGYA